MADISDSRTDFSIWIEKTLLGYANSNKSLTSILNQ